MGAGAAIPAKIDYQSLQELTGDRISKALFIDHQVGGFITKEKVFQIFPNLTDCFLTHDWGKDEQGRNNHDRVSRVNASLKERGLITWFDSERMQGNIVQQMCSGIDCAQCVIVFVTKNYMAKVGGENANDNCQLEFNFAVRRKSAKRMIAVVMEAQMRDPNMWNGPVGMALGGSLYVDFVSDDKWEDQCDTLFKTITQMISPYKIGENSVVLDATTTTDGRDRGGGGEQAASDANGGHSKLESAPTSSAQPIKHHHSGSNTKSVEDLSVNEVAYLLYNLKMVAFVTNFVNNRVDGIMLAYAQSDIELIQMGIQNQQKARYLFAQIEQYKAFGVANSLLVPPINTVTATATVVSSNSNNSSTATTYVGTKKPAVSSVAAVGGGCATAGATADHSHVPMQLGAKNTLTSSSVNSSPRVSKLSKATPSVPAVSSSSSSSRIYPHIYAKDYYDYCASEAPSFQFSVGTGEQASNVQAASAAAAAVVAAAHKSSVGHHSVHIRGGDESVVGRMLNGVFDLVLGSKVDSYPIYQKRADAMTIIEYNDSHQCWQVKPVSASGSGKCVAEIKAVVKPLSVEYSTISNADTTDKCAGAAAATSSSTSVSTRPRELHLCTDCSWDVFDGNGAFVKDPNVKLLPAALSVSLYGVPGKIGERVNGVYHPTQDMYGGAAVYRKAAPNEKNDSFLEYNEKRKTWQLKPVTARGTNSCMAEVKCDSIYPEYINACWEVVLDDSGFHKQPSVGIYIMPHRIYLSGMVGGTLSKVNGLYEPTGESYNNAAVYRKATDHALIMEYNQGRKTWQLKSASSHGKDSCAAEAHCSLCLPPEYVVAPWRVADPSGSGATAMVVREYHPVKISGAEGPHATKLNGVYIPVADRSTFSSGSGSGASSTTINNDVLIYAGAPVFINQQESSNMILEYNTTHKAWQIKPDTVCGTPKCIAEMSIPSAYKVRPHHQVDSSTNSCSPLRELNPPVAPQNCEQGKWQVSDGTSFVAQIKMTVTRWQ